MTPTRRRLAGALLLPLLLLGIGACTDSDDGDDAGADRSEDTAPDTTEGSGDVPETCGEPADAPSEGETSTSEAETGAEATEAAAEFTFLPLDVGGPITKAALADSDIDIAVLFSSDGAIAQRGWVALEDDKNLQPADNFVPAIRSDACDDAMAAVLDAVSAELTVEMMQEMVASVAIDGDNAEDVAAAWLEENGVPGDLTAEGSLTVGSGNFAESNIAAQLYGQALAAAGVDVDYQADIGARDVYFTALESGEIDLVPEFTGTLLSFLDGDAEPSPDLEATLADLRAVAAPRGISILTPAEADSVNTFVVREGTAERYDLATVSDLATVEDSLVLGGPPECPERAHCILGLEETYGLRFAD